MIRKFFQSTNNPEAAFARFVLDEDKCNGCGACVAACPMQILMIADGRACPNWRYDHFRCITCQNCVATCPNTAITIEGDYRVEAGFWKNTHLFEGGKTLPAPIRSRAGEPFEQIEDQLTETERVIYRRRSVRLYKKKPVERDLVERVIEAGRFAPSAGNNQPWKFIAITNRQVIDEINDKCKRSLRKGTFIMMPHAYLDKKTPGDPNAKLNWWQNMVMALLCRIKTGDVEPRARGGINTVTSDPDYHIFFNAPVLIILLADKRGIGSIQLDTGICGQNMVLAAHSMGLGTCWVSLVRGLGFYPAFRRALGIDDQFEIISSLTLGWPKMQIDNVVAREQARIRWIE